MRSVVLFESTLVIVIALVALMIFFVPGKPQMLVYPLVRQAAQAKLNYETRHMASYDTEHFTIRYTEQDAGMVEMVALAAEKAYAPVTESLRYKPTTRTLIVVYPDRQELNRAFGWSGDQSAMGVYWGGVIQILSPHVWLKTSSADEFIHSGPMVHEFTHLVFDHMTRGNYPRWFTEGLAQYTEYKINKYEWHTAGNSLKGGLYSMSQLDRDFDVLDNQALAYRQSLAAVRYIAEAHGTDKLQQVIANLKAGNDIETSIHRVTGLGYTQFEEAWKKWANANMD